MSSRWKPKQINPNLRDVATVRDYTHTVNIKGTESNLAFCNACGGCIFFDDDKEPPRVEYCARCGYITQGEHAGMRFVIGK